MSCPHVSRTIADHRLSGILIWRCNVCGLWAHAVDWEEFDQQAGCVDWQRGWCDHLACLLLRLEAVSA